MEEKRIIFNSSLPRSGSTLLQNILPQNPRIYASPTSGLLELLFTSRSHFSRLPEFHAQDQDAMRRAFRGYCRGALIGFYDGLTDKPICIDKNRSWLHLYNWLSMFYPDPKILICIRDLRAILSSMEKLFRTKRDLVDPLDTPDRPQMVTITARVSTWLNSMPVGVAMQRLTEAIEADTVSKCHILRYEDLTSRPQETIKRVYEYLEEPYFEHDFDHVSQTTRESDWEAGIYGDHKIREKVSPMQPDYNDVLGKERCEQVKSLHRLFYSRFYPDR